MSFVLVTDSSANLPEDLIKKFDIKIISLSFFVDNEEYLSYKEDETTDISKFYKMMRSGKVIKTSLINEDTFIKNFEKYLKEGHDILYIGMTSGISGTYNASVLASDSLKEMYPDRRIVTIDSLSVSLGLGLLVYYAALLKEKGKSIDEIKEWIEENKLKMRHQFTVEDLMFLKRGGRIPATVAIIGSVLNIKPLLKVDKTGILVNIGKARGRKNSLDKIFETLECAEDIENQYIGITHGDCIDDVNYLVNKIKEKYKPKDIIINYVDPVIGAHSGPGTMALFFLAKDKNR